MNKSLRVLALVTLALAPVSTVAHAGTDGINRLIAVTQLKADNANGDAMDGADKQRELVKKQKVLRAQQAAFDALVRDGSVSSDRLDTNLLVCDICSLVDTGAR
jgi:hypothetical protein